jgi:hypothetical protein
MEMLFGIFEAVQWNGELALHRAGEVKRNTRNGF